MASSGESHICHS